MTASMRNAIKRVAHKERSQPARRKKLGLLEKHKDYTIRAKDFNFKKKRINALQQKAAFRNPDEFYYKMTSAKTKGGVHQVDNGLGGLSVEMVKAVKSLDARYLEGQRGKELRKIERLRSNLHFVGAASRNTHTVFVDDADEAAKFDKAEYFDTLPEVADSAHNRLRKSDLAAKPLIDEKAAKALNVAAKRVKSGYSDLEFRVQRQGKIASALTNMKVQKDLASKGRKKKVKDAEGDKPAVYRWKSERKR